MEAFNFKTNFIGHDGFVWWIGQVAPNESWIKNFDDVSQVDQANETKIQSISDEEVENIRNSF